MTSPLREVEFEGVEAVPSEFSTDLCSALMHDFQEAIIIRSQTAADKNRCLIRPAETLEALLRSAICIMEMIPSMKNPETRRELVAAIYMDMMAGVGTPSTNG